jgi:hypothetical protein
MSNVALQQYAFAIAFDDLLATIAGKGVHSSWKRDWPADTGP